MPLIVEDGTGIANSNSYIGLVDARAYALSRGSSLSADDATVEAQLLRGMDYLEGKGLGLLSLTFPPSNGFFCGSIKLDRALALLSRAQTELSIQQEGGVDLFPTATDAFIIEEKIGPIVTKYSDRLGGGAGSSPDMPIVDDLLAPLLSACGHKGSGAFFTAIRV